MIKLNFANEIAAEGIEGTYVTSLASVNNLGRQVGDSAFLYAYNNVSFDFMVFLGWIY